MYKCQILADKIYSLTDARYFSARYADILCFDLVPDMPLLNLLTHFNAIKEWVSGPEIYLKTNHISQESLEYLINEINPTGIVISFLDHYKLEESTDLKIIWEIMPEIDFNEASIFAPSQNDKVLIDFKSIPIEKIDISRSILKKYATSHELFVKNLDFENTLQCLSAYPNIKGIAFNGSNELNTGLKLFEDIDVFLDALEQ